MKYIALSLFLFTLFIIVKNVIYIFSLFFLYKSVANFIKKYSSYHVQTYLFSKDDFTKLSLKSIDILQKKFPESNEISSMEFAFRRILMNHLYNNNDDVCELTYNKFMQVAVEMLSVNNSNMCNAYVTFLANTLYPFPKEISDKKYNRFLKRVARLKIL